LHRLPQTGRGGRRHGVVQARINPDGVHKFSMPRGDLKVGIDGVEVKPGFALGSWAGFSKRGDDPWPRRPKQQRRVPDALKLAKGLRAAVDLTNSARDWANRV